MSQELIKPHGGELIELFLSAEQSEGEKQQAKQYKSWDLTQRQLCDIELLLNGGFSPLRGFMGQGDYENVVENMRLSSGILWPIPITLDVSREFSAQVKPNDIVALRDPEGVLIATLQVSDIWEPDLKQEALKVYGTKDDKHPAVNYLFNH
ncbi:MAG: adenylyltransferase, partial [Gammaproteobacteria bacterium]|nr:adenylyltransferase [Gammaproteobacteria bacterium]